MNDIYTQFKEKEPKENPGSVSYVLICISQTISKISTPVIKLCISQSDSFEKYTSISASSFCIPASKLA